MPGLVAPEAKEPEKPVFKEGDRVVATRINQTRHGTIIKESSMTMQPLFGSGKKSTSYYYDVKTDEGATWIAINPENLNIETEKADLPTYFDIELDGRLEQPESILQKYQYSKKQAQHRRGKGARARLPSTIGQHKAAEKEHEDNATRYKKLFEQWALKYPGGLQKFYDAGIEIPWEKKAPAPVKGKGGIALSYHETRHAQKNIDLFVISIDERVESDVFRDLRSKAKQLGGYWSRYTKMGAIPGFQFTKKSDAEEFMASFAGKKEGPGDRKSVV